MFLIDNDLRLRAIEPTDDHVLYQLINDPDVARQIVGWSGPVALASQSAWASSVGAQEFRYIIEHDGVGSGVVMLNPVDFKNRCANVHIKLFHAARGRGLGKRAIRLIIALAFEELDMAIVTAGVLDSNSPSQRLFESIGFIKDGVLRSRVHKSGARRGIIQYSMLREEYAIASA